MSDPLEMIFDDIDEIFAPTQKKAQEATEEETRRLTDDMRVVLATPEGRRFVWWVLSRGNLFASIFTGRSLDQAYYEGQRTIASETLCLALKADPGILSKLVHEKLFKQE